MPVGTVTFQGNATRKVCVMENATANVAAPTAATDGVPVYPTSATKTTPDGLAFFGMAPESATLFISTRAGSGVMVGTFTLWGYLEETAAWYPVTVNGGAALAETGTDVIRYQQNYTSLGHFDRIALQLASIGGTATAFDAYLVTHRKGTV